MSEQLDELTLKNEPSPDPAPKQSADGFKLRGEIPRVMRLSRKTIGIGSFGIKNHILACIESILRDNKLVIIFI